MLMLTRRSHGSTLLPLVLTAILAATALSAIAALASPQQALGASTFTAKCDANLRTKPSSSATRKAVLPDGGQMYAVTMVSGGSWSLVCNGRLVPGNSWYRISNVNGRSAQVRYGVSYVYAATALFAKNTLYKKYAKCDGVSLRASAEHDGDQEGTLPAEGVRPGRATGDRRQLVDDVRRRQRVGHVVVPDRLRRPARASRRATA